MYHREIIYTGRPQCDYAMYIDGELIGFAPTYNDAFDYLTAIINELMHGATFAKDQKDATNIEQ